MGSLVEAVKDPAKRPAVISDCTRMLDAEVAGKRGLSGVAVKAGFKAIRKFKPDIVPSALEDLIDRHQAARNDRHRLVGNLGRIGRDDALPAEAEADFAKRRLTPSNVL